MSIGNNHGIPSPNERIKGDSNFLQGTIAEDLKNDVTGGFGPIIFS